MFNFLRTTTKQLKINLEIKLLVNYLKNNYKQDEACKIGNHKIYINAVRQNPNKNMPKVSHFNRFNRHEIYIGNLRHFITKYQIGDHFQQYGNVEDVFIKQSGYETNYGFVLFEDAESIERVYDDLVSL